MATKGVQTLLLTLGIFYILYQCVDGQCSGDVNLTAGGTAQDITSANFPAQYPSDNRACRWRLTTAAGYTDIYTRHNIKKFSPNDKVEIIPDCDPTSPNIVTYDSTRSFVTSQGGYTSPVCVEFTVNSGTSNDGFKVTFVAFPQMVPATVCSTPNPRTATTVTQYLFHPNFPADYPSNEECRWTIDNGGTGKDIILTFEVRYLEDSADCLDVTTADGNTIQYCQDDVFPSLLTQQRSSNFSLYFKSDDSDQYAGFVVSYILEEPCKGELNQLQAELGPNYLKPAGHPGDYQSAVKSGPYRCTWQINQFESSGLFLSLELDTLADGDTLFIYEGSSDKSGTLLFPSPGDTYTDSCFFCNKNVTIVSSSSAYVEFNVSSSGDAGFELGYLADFPSTNAAACSASSASPLSLEANNTLQLITYFDNAFPSSDCYWNITDGGTGRGVILTVEYAFFDPSCTDTLVITDHESTQTPICSSTKEYTAVVFRKNFFNIKFSSNQLSKEHGFSISYILDAPCKDTVTLIKAELAITTLSTPDYPSPYPGVGRSGGYVCKWHIEAETSTTGILIKYAFDRLQRGDALVMYEGCDSTGVEKYRSNNETISNGNTAEIPFTGSVYVEFVVTSSTGDLGLQLFITSQIASDNTEACTASGKVVEATSDVQYITNTNFPQEYGINENCKWYISPGNSGQRVFLTVEFYDIEQANDCNNDYLKIEGPSTSAVQVCGEGFTQPLISFNDTSFNVSFIADDEDNYNGFVFSVVLDKPCTERTPTMLTADVDVKSFTSVGYPNNYTWNRQTGNYTCEWHIEASDGTAGILLYLDIGGLGSGTVLNVYQGCDNTGNKLYPSAATDPTMTTPAVQLEVAAGNSSFVEFSVGSAGGQGFQIQYLSISATDNTAACGASVSSPVTLAANDTIQYLTSSNFPEPYLSSLQCFWNITDGGTDRGVILTVEFNHFASSCQDYIEVTAGSDTTGTKVCSDTFNTSPMVFKNTSFQLMFNSDATNNASGFVISYILDAPCKGEITQIKAELPITTISSPDYPASYPGVGRSGGYVCKWHIEAETSTTGILIGYSFDRLQLGDALVMYEGSDSAGVEKFISDNTKVNNGNTAEVSFNGSAYVEFVVTSSTGDLGLQLMITAQKASDNTEACSANGKVVEATKDVQYFTSTNFPQEYGGNEKCHWFLSGGNSGRNVILTVEFYDIEVSTGCGNDYLKIEGPSTSASQTCGENFNHPLITFNDTSLNVSFISDDEDFYRGFVFSVVLDKPCTESTPTMLTADVDVKSFTSPYYPANYTWNRQTDNYTCEWHIEASDGTAGILLDLDMSGLSSGTYLNIYDGSDNTGTRLYPTTNAAHPATAERVQIATGNSAFIEFIVGSTGGQGFRVHYISIPATDNTEACAGNPGIELNATDSIQYITSSNFPQVYNGGLTCKWEINDAASGRGVFLNLIAYHIECPNDKLDLTGGDGIPTTKCSDDLVLSPENFTSSSSFILDFVSNAAVNKHGFVLSYILGPPCNGSDILLVANENIQELSSPFYPDNYPSAIPIGSYMCVWRIQSSDNVAKLLLTVEAQNLTEGNTLEIFQDNIGGTLLTSQLGTGLSPGMTAVVRFSVTSSGSSGFIIKYAEQRPVDTTQACSDTNLQITATSTPAYLTSPNFPDLYPNDENCTWSIDDGGTYRGIILQLLVYEIQNSTNCEKDQLVIRQGSTNDETKVCSDTVVTTTQNFTDESSFEIHFKTDATVTHHGFQLRHIVGAPCNGSVIELNSISELKQFVSPEYPAYPGTLYSGPYTCNFVINPQDGADGNLMSFNLSGIDAADNIVIYDGRNNSGIQIFPSARRKRSTGITNQVVVRNSGSSAFIEFMVNSPMGATGFVVDYVSHPVTNNTGACSTTTSQLVATSTIQYITSSNFPAIYPSDQNCTWHISNANSGINVMFTLITYQIQEQGSSCDGDRLNIQLGPGRTPNIRCSNALSLTPEVFKGSSIDVEFLSDNTTTINEHGFLFSYILDIPCKGGPTQLSADTTVRKFSTPEYPSNYPSTAFIGTYTCDWAIQAQEPGAGILLILNIDGLNAGDTALVYSGINNTGTRLYPTTVNLQTNTSASTFHFSPGSSAFVSFTANTTANRGFHVLYMAIAPSNTTVACASNGNHQMVATTNVQYITSPRFPNLYAAGLSCRWTISTGGLNADITMTVIVLHTEGDVCSNDTLVITGAGASTINLCSEEVSTTSIEYTDRQFDIMFITNDGNNNRGFVISYVIGPEKPRYVWSEKLAITLAVSVGTAVLFLVLAVVVIACLRQKAYVRKRRPRSSLRSFSNGSFINTHASANGHSNGDLQLAKSDRDSPAPSWINMFRTSPSSPYIRYDLPRN
ncbi:cubilin-like isoform X1 [Argopecten irradians]|uniref:cubilin-like isoform X1 n=1 Tax=Argopecten irradians TaxID=31199 RepID=UPI00371EF7AE